MDMVGERRGLLLLAREALEASHDQCVAGDGPFLGESDGVASSVLLLSPPVAKLGREDGLSATVALVAVG